MSADGVKPAGNRLFLKKSIAQIQKEAAKSELKRTLGPLNLMSLGIGAIIGAGIFVLTGQVASAHAGPAIMFSFVIAGIACALAGLCYAEFAALHDRWARTSKAARRRFVAANFDELAVLVAEESVRHGDKAFFLNRALPFDGGAGE